MGKQFTARSAALVVTLVGLAGGFGSVAALQTSDTTVGTAGGLSEPLFCVGDCNADLAVTIEELVAAVTIALERADVARCLRADADRNTRVTIDELVGAVNRVLNGCETTSDPTPTASPTPRLSVSPGQTPTLSPTLTATPDGTTRSTATPTRSPNPTVDATGAPTATHTASISPGTPVSTATRTATDVPAATATPTGTATPVPPSPTPTTPIPPGPRITFFGVVRADNSPTQPDLFDPEGRPVFIRALGQGMSVIVEARPGTNLRPVGQSAFSESGFPDLQMLVSRALGDGRPEVCDVDVNAPDLIGGVPATPDLEFLDVPTVINATNDLGCRVDNGLGQPVARTADRDACTRSSTSTFGFGFVDSDTTAQFCLPIAGKWEFPLGDTKVRARVRGQDGTVGPPEEVVIRVIGQ